MRVDDPRHGTRGGYDAHRRDRERACRPCSDAAARYQRGLDWDLLNGRTRKVPADGTLRRLRALVALGWTTRQIADALGTHRNDIRRRLVVREPSFVRQSTAQRAAALFESWSMQIPPQSSYATRARNLALRHGWPPPLAWDDIDNDPEPSGVGYVAFHPFDAEMHNDVDPVVVERILAGDWRLTCTRAEKEAVVARWTGALEDLARFTGWRVERYVAREVA